MRDGMNDYHLVTALAPAAAVTDDTAQVSAIIDRRGYDSLTFELVTGANADADATFTVLVEDDDDSGFGTAAAVPDDQLVGTEADASFTFADDGEPRKIGYIGDKRYVRVTVTPANNTGNLFLAILARLGCPALRPTANPPI